MKKITLELKNGLKFYVSGQDITLALENVNVSFSTGEFVVITGESGGGKSTLAHILAGVFPCDSGELLVNGVSLLQEDEAGWEKYRRDYISFAAQNYGILAGNSVYENVFAVLLLVGMETEEAKKRTEYLLKQVDLWKLRRRKAGKLSSGQKQRLSVARAVAKPAPILIADEPTSNLDWSTAEKIIRLLAEEGKERLVVVITHNFEIIQEYATRHLVMRDGKTEEKTVACETNVSAVTEIWESEAKKQSADRRNSSYIARLQLKARPVLTLFMTLFFMLTAFGVFVFLGTFLSVLDDTGTKRYSNELFQNGSEKRLVVMKPERAAFTEEDYFVLSNVPRIVTLERYGVLADINCHYRENVDYKYEIMSDGGGFDTETTYRWAPVLLETDTFLQTVPVLPEGKVFLTAGRLPEHFHEIVAVGEEELLGTEITVYFTDAKNWGQGLFVENTMTVVGVTDVGEGIYFDDRVGIMFWQADACAETILKKYMGTKIYYLVNQSVSREGFVISGDLATLWAEYGIDWRSVQSLPSLKTRQPVMLKPQLSEHTLPYVVMGISEENFDAMAYEENCREVSVFIEDYAYAERVMAKIRSLGYEVISPYKIGSVLQDNDLAEERLNTLLLCLMAFLVVAVAQIVVLSVLFCMQTENYAGLRNLGLSFKTGKNSVRRQIGVLTMLGQGITILLVMLFDGKKVAYITNIVKYL